MKIPKILRGTRVSELNSLAQQLIDRFKADDWSTDAYLSEIFERIAEINLRLGESIMRDRTESELAMLDDIADQAITNLHGLAKGYTYHPDDTISRPAQTIFKLIEKYGLQVKNKSYMEEYSLLNSLISDSKAGEYATSIASLPGCAKRLNQLEDSVQQFITKQNAYHTAKDDEQNQASASEIKKELITVINDELSLYLNAMALANAAIYELLSDFTANRIIESNTKVRSRHN